MDINDRSASYASIPMPYPGQGNLLSDWPKSFCQRVYRQPAAIDPAIMNNVRMSGNIGYAKLPDGMGRQFPYRASGAPESGKYRSTGSQSHSRGKGRGSVAISVPGICAATYVLQLCVSTNLVMYRHHLLVVAMTHLCPSLSNTKRWRSSILDLA